MVIVTDDDCGQFPAVVNVTVYEPAVDEDRSIIPVDELVKLRPLVDVKVPPIRVCEAVRVGNGSVSDTQYDELS